MFRKLYDRFLDLFLVRREEVPLLVLLGANVFFSINSLIVSQIVAESLFLSAYDSDVLVYMYGASGLSAAIAGVIYSQLQERTRPGFFEISVLVFFIGCFAAFWALIYLRGKWVYIALLVFAEVFGTLIIIQAWGIATSLLSSRAAKRLVPVIGGFGTLAGITAGAMVGFLAEIIGTVNLTGVVLLDVGGCFLVTSLLLGRMRAAPVHARGGKSDAGKTRRNVSTQSLFTNRFFQILVSITTLATLASIFVDYQFKVFSQAYFSVDGELRKDALSEFYGYFQIVVTILALIVQLGLASRVLERYGLAVTLVLLPLVIVFGTAGILFGVGGYFVAASIARGGDKVLRFSLYGSASQILYLALPDRLQKKARSIANGVMRPITILVASFLLVFLTRWAGFSDPQISYVTAGVAILWIILSITAGREYLAQLMRTLERRRIRFEKGKATITDKKAIDEIVGSFPSSNPAEVLEALALAERIEERMLCEEFRALLDHAEPRVRRRALIMLAGSECPLGEEMLAPLIGDSDHDVQVEAIKALGRLCGEAPHSTLAGFLEDPDLAIRGAAISAVIANPDTGLEEQAHGELEKLLRSEEPAERIAGIDALQNWSPDEVVTRLLPLLDDLDPGVRDRAIRVGADLADPRIQGALLQQLRGGARPLIIEAFRDPGPELVDGLREILLDPATTPWARRLATRILENIGAAPALDALLEDLSTATGSPSSLDTAKAAAAIVTAAGTPLPRERVEPILADLIHRIYQMTAWQVDTRELSRGNNLELLEAVIKDRHSRLIETLFLVLRLLYPPESIEIAHRYLNDRSAKRRDNALEILSQTLARGDRCVILAQLEATSPEEALESAGDSLPVQRKRGEMWVTDWLSSDDPWLRAASLWALSSFGEDGYQDLVEEAVGAEHPLIRETAAVVLARGSQLSPSLLERLLDDPDETVRTRATELSDTVEAGGANA